MALAKADAAGTKELQSHILMLEGKPDLAEEQFRKALIITESKVDTVMRYLALQAMWGASTRVGQLVDEFWELLKNNPAAVKGVRDVLTQTGWFGRAWRCDADLARMKAVSEPTSAYRVDHDEFAEESLARAVEFVHAYLHSKQLVPEAAQTTVVPFEDGVTAFMYQLAVPFEPEKAAQLEWELLEAIDSEGFDAVESGRLIFAFMPEGDSPGSASKHARN